MWKLAYKETEHRRIDAFELWCWRRLLRISWTARRSNQSILKEISPEYSLEGLMLKLKHQYIDHLMQRTDSLEKLLMVGKIEGRMRTGWHKLRWLDGITKWMDMILSKLRVWWWTGKPGVLQSMWSQRVWHTEWLNWKLLKTSFWFKNYGKIIVELFPLCIEYSYLSSFSLLVMTIETILNIYYEHCWKLSSVSVCLFLKKNSRKHKLYLHAYYIAFKKWFPKFKPDSIYCPLCDSVSFPVYFDADFITKWTKYSVTMGRKTIIWHNSYNQMPVCDTVLKQ